MTPLSRPALEQDPPEGMPATRTHVVDAPPASVQENDVTLFGLVQVLWRQRFVIAATAALVVLAAAAIVLARPRTYSSTVAFVPQEARAQSNLAGLAEQFGIAATAAGGTQTPAFYLELLRSRPILRQVALAPYTVRTDSGEVRGTLVELWHLDAESPPARVDAAIRRLDESIDASTTASTGIVRFSVRAREPELAQQMADRLVALVNQFNLETRRSRAAAEREFVAERLQAVAAELRAAEGRLQAFLQRNRGLTVNAPALRFEEERLNRDVSLQRQLHASLAESHEQARIDAVRDTPVITVIETAEVPTRPDPRGLLRTVLVAGFAGLALGMAVGMLRELKSQVARQRRTAVHATG